jgi:hypothetical protein
MRFGGGEFSTGTTGNFQPELTLYDFLPSIPAEQPSDGMVVGCSLIVRQTTFIRVVCDSGQVESLRLQSPSAQEGLRVSHLHNPRAGRPS